MANGIPKRTLIREIKRLAREVTIDDLQLAWSKSAAKGLGLMILDRRYLAVPEETWRKVLQYSGVDSVPYREESRDCDDFAFALRGELPLKLGLNGVGIILDSSGKHAYSALLVWGENGLEVDFVEPQTDRIISQDPESPYAMRAGTAIF